VLDDVVAQLVAEQAAGTDAADGAAAPPIRIWVAHRVGPLEIGDPALVCAVSAAHRGQAFAVCSELVDRVKAQVPIWKEQFFSDGTVEWVGAGE
jgi:molybdopterin synthase catalytic subunit